MSVKLKNVRKRILEALLKACSIIFHMIKIPYWIIVRFIVIHWGKRGLHSITIGEFSGGLTKKRSIYREEILIKTIILFAEIKEKSCLDLACNDGFWSFRLARFGLRKVTGIDMRKENILRANFLKYIYDFPSFQFERKDIFEFLHHNKSNSYDIILLLSILYHLPEETNWQWFFNALSQMNNECLIIDTRWFEDDAYWYDKTSAEAVIKTEDGLIKKWRLTRKEVFDYLYESGYEQIVEINPSAFLSNSDEAYGNGNPYTLENVSDYITGNRTIVIAYKKITSIPNIQNRLNVNYIERKN